MNVATAPPAVMQIELQIAISLRCFGNVLKGGGTERRAPEIGVEYYARCIDDAPERKARIGIEFFGNLKIDRAHAVDKTVTSQLSFGNLFTYASENGSRSF
jgi:hypothetical protein